MCKQLCRRSSEKHSDEHTCSIAVLPVATRLLERSGRGVQIDSVLLSRCRGYLDKGGWITKAIVSQGAAHKKQGPSAI